MKTRNGEERSCVPGDIVNKYVSLGFLFEGHYALIALKEAKFHKISFCTVAAVFLPMQIPLCSKLEQIWRCLGHKLNHLFFKHSSSYLSAERSIFMVKVSTVTCECYFLNGILDAL